MKKPTFNRGQRVFYIKGDILVKQLVLEAYYLEEYDDNSGKYYLTTNKEKIHTFNQKNTHVMFDDEIITVSEYHKIHNYSEKKIKKYQTINDFLCDNFDAYHNATRYLLFRDNFQELFNALGDNENLYKNTKDKKYYTHSRLCKNIIKIPYFYGLRFKFNITWKYVLGTIKNIFYLPFFFKDLIANLYRDYFIYRIAKHDKRRFEKEKEFLPHNGVQERHNNEEIARLEQNIENKREIYIKSNIAFFTFILAIIVFIVTVVIHTNTVNKKDEEIATLKIKNEKLEQEIDGLKNTVETEILINQNQINSDLVLTINKLTEIVNELKKERETIPENEK